MLNLLPFQEAACVFDNEETMPVNSILSVDGRRLHQGPTLMQTGSRF